MNAEPKKSCDVAVDVGNTRIKWGRCTLHGVVQVAALSPDLASWTQQLAAWNLTPTAHWVVSGVHPERREALAHWLRGQGFIVSLIDSHHQIPLQVEVDYPERVGLDRLLGAVAANSRRTPGRPALIVDAGSAITVNWVDGSGLFQGGAIMPGLRLMARALHEHTAQLPLVEIQALPPLPGKNTAAAIASGILHAARGGVRSLIDHLCAGRQDPDIFFTGGDAPLLALDFPRPVTLWPEMILEGIRLSAASG